MTPDGPERRRRLHPLTPALKGAKIFAATVAAISWKGFAELGFLPWLGLVFVILVGATALSVASWLVTGFHVVGRELRVHEGLLWRRTRAIPLERIQAIDVVRPVLARMAGVAELRLEVVGTGKTEAPLAFLTVVEAELLREQLLALARASSASPGRRADGDVDITRSGDSPVDVGRPAGPLAGVKAADEAPLHAVRNADVLVGNLLTPPVLALPVALAITLVPLTFEPLSGSWISIASMVTALFGVVLPPLRRIMNDWNFRISIDPVGFRLRHGLLDTRSRTIPSERVQAVAITAPLLWRRRGWLRTRLDVAGYGVDATEQGVRGGVLLPIGDRATTRAVVGRFIAGVDVATLPFMPVARIARFVSPLAWRKRAFGFTDQVAATRDGWLTEHIIIARLARIQSVRVVQGPLQRRLGLADLHVDTAGGLHAVARDRLAAEAYSLATRLAALSRSARAAEAHDRHHRSAAPTTTNTSPTYSQPTSTSIR